MSSGTPPTKANMAPGVIRHTILMKNSTRDGMSKLAKAFNTQQGQLCAAFLAIAQDPVIANKIKSWFAANPTSQLTSSPGKMTKEALKKVDPAALEAFLKAQGAL